MAKKYPRALVIQRFTSGKNIHTSVIILWKRGISLGLGKNNRRHTHGNVGLAENGVYLTVNLLISLTDKWSKFTSIKIFINDKLVFFCGIIIDNESRLAKIN